MSCSLSSRFYALTRSPLRQFGLCHPPLLATCRHTGPSKSTVRWPNPDLEKYKQLQKHFKRRLRATYSKFSDLPDTSAICGRNYVYSRVRVSPSEKHLAATVKSSSREQARCVVVKLTDPASPPQDVPQIVFTLDNVFNFEWANDVVLFYTTQEGLRCGRVFRLDLTSPAATHGPVFQDTRPDVFVEVALSRDGRLLTINSNSKTDSEVWFIDVTTPTFDPVLVQPRLPELMYHVEHWRDWLVILANTGPGQEYQVLRAPPATPSQRSWVAVHTPRPGVTLRDVEVVGDHCVVTAREPDGGLTLTAVPLDDPGEEYSVPLPRWACACKSRRPGPGDPREALRFLLSSPARPQVAFSFYPEDRVLLSGTEAEGTSPEAEGTSPEAEGTSPEEEGGRGGKHVTERLEVRSQDGTMVPVTVFRPVAAGSGLQQAPLLLHVYGAYGRDLDMGFSPDSRLLLEQGWVLAYCHIRGGGELGLSWHRRARVQGKRAGVEDLRACLRHLHSRGISSPRRSAITARSAGAVPVGALCNTDPRLMRAAPFLDVLGCMMDDSLPLTVEEREEWGDPIADPQHRLAIASYCPLHNIAPQRYPSMLLTAYSDDARVPLAGVVRYAEEPAADHFGPNHFDAMLEEKALQLAFLYAELGLDSPRPPPPPPRRRR
ncbi:hypothetical protein NHX12_022049 [Muraenolepis orangiensis]|uniref:Prolyl endopeptidase n=1 Tax=Muraenolepis orangiensis TaxID=630683 RepID=A0A9Q0ITM6_9TELE|nr:hypothetical protein NHX12_022049 [Muraenolepis orangiensis]